MNIMLSVGVLDPVCCCWFHHYPDSQPPLGIKSANMGVGSARKSAAKNARTPVKSRRSTSKAIKAEDSPTKAPASSSKGTPSRSGGGFTSRLPSEQDRRNNGRVTGRSLIVWGRKS